MWHKERPLTEKELKNAIANLSDSEDDLDRSSDEEGGSFRNTNQDEVNENLHLKNLPIFVENEPIENLINAKLRENSNLLFRKSQEEF